MKDGSSGRHVVLASIGTDGDLYPFLGLGRALSERGHRATLVANGHFDRLAASAGIGFRALVGGVEADAVFGHPDFWHPRKGAFMLARWGARLIPRQYGLLSELAGGGAVLVSSPGVVAARLLQERAGLPLASIVLQPWLLPSLHAPVRMMGIPGPPVWAPRPVVRVYQRMLDALAGTMLGGELNRLRASLGLAPVRRIFQWWLSPQLVLGMFPACFGPPQPDWPAVTKLAGFPGTDAGAAEGVPEELRRFCAAGDPPVAFTFGTGMSRPEPLMLSAVEACRRLGLRAVLLTRFRAGLPGELPPHAHVCGFAPFQDLFPRCAAVVHHGGVGTTAKALAAGRPQLILPFAFDQLDNAVRVERLGAGGWIPRGRRDSGVIVAGLRRILERRFVTGALRAAEQLAGPSGLELGADWLDEWIRVTLPTDLAGRTGPTKRNDPDESSPRSRFGPSGGPAWRGRRASESGCQLSAERNRSPSFPPRPSLTRW